MYSLARFLHRCVKREGVASVVRLQKHAAIFVLCCNNYLKTSGFKVAQVNQRMERQIQRSKFRTVSRGATINVFQGVYFQSNMLRYVWDKLGNKEETVLSVTVKKYQDAVHRRSSASFSLVFQGKMSFKHDRFMFRRHAVENEKLKSIFKGCY